MWRLWPAQPGPRRRRRRDSSKALIRQRPLRPEATKPRACPAYPQIRRALPSVVVRCIARLCGMIVTQYVTHRRRLRHERVPGPTP